MRAVARAAFRGVSMLADLSAVSPTVLHANPLSVTIRSGQGSTFASSRQCGVPFLRASAFTAADFTAAQADKFCDPCTLVYPARGGDLTPHRAAMFGYHAFGMPYRPLRRWVLWMLALWVSVLTPLAALGCVQACGRVWDDGRCCASETTLPCSDHPCSCAPCPVCSAPEPSPVWAKTEEPKPPASAPVGVLTFALELPRLAAQPTPLPQPPFIPPDTGVKWRHPHRAPPVLA
jgi:hypothetical protein